MISLKRRTSFFSIIMRLKSLNGCKLAIGRYPYFDYDASSGGGEASLSYSNKESNQYLKFDPNNFLIPSLNWRTCKVLGLPFPPGLEIVIHLDKLEGIYNRSKGDISLEFESRFILKLFSIIYFPQIIVRTCLSNAKVNSKIHHFEGKSVQKNGTTIIGGIATIPPTGNKLLDIFLGLPNEALAVLKCNLIFNDS